MDSQIAKITLIIQFFLMLGAPVPSPADGPSTRPYLLHLPGVGGFMPVDRELIAGLRDGGVDARITAYDWTEHDPGLDALHAYDRNQRQAAHIAELLLDDAAADPAEPIILTSHSGGGAIAVWALEKLPAGVQVSECFLLAPALSPGYDLTAALRHVRGKMYVFWSRGDELILGLGCRVCGTMDGPKTDAAGKVGFHIPSGADAVEYKKLDQRPYNPRWWVLGNFGNHIGPMSRAFAARILAPLLIDGMK